MSVICLLIISQKTHWSAMTHEICNANGDFAYTNRLMALPWGLNSHNEEVCCKWQMFSLGYEIWLEECQGFEVRLATSCSPRACVTWRWLQGNISCKLFFNYTCCLPYKWGKSQKLPVILPDKRMAQFMLSSSPHLTDSLDWLLIFIHYLLRTQVTYISPHAGQVPFRLPK
jgi:hypothetical protein